MKSLKTQNIKSKITTYIAKEFTALTPGKNKVTLIVQKREIQTEGNKFVSAYEYGLRFKGTMLVDPQRNKDILLYYLDFVDKYADTRFL